LRGFPDRLVDDRVEGDDARDKLPSHRLDVIEIGSGDRQRPSKSTGNLGGNGREQRSQAPRGVAEIGGGKYHSGANDTDDDLAAPTDGKQEGGICIDPAGGAEQVAGDDRCRVAGQCRRIGREVAQQRRGERAGTTPQRQSSEKQHAVLWEAGGQHHDRDSADDGADHAVPALAQRRAEMGLADDRRRGAGPDQIVELKPERDVERKRH
jgi:hypothetical protein